MEIMADSGHLLILFHAAQLNRKARRARKAGR
jgi:hypothetical protein